jgi:YegS/Rv2252/BmrU family lipid kinase
MVVAERRGHAIELARAAGEAGRQMVVAAGGDGTINEVVNGLKQAVGDGTAGPLGILPIGSGNDFARSMGIPLNLIQAAQKLRQRQTRIVDLGCVNGRYFDNNVGIGFEALVGIESHKITWFSGMAMYLAAACKTLITFPRPTVNIYLDQKDIREKDILSISVGNNRRIGGGFLLTPHAQPDDGLLDVCVVDAIPRLKILALLPKIITGNYRGEPAVFLTQSKRLVIESDHPLPVHADGEILWHDLHHIQITVEAKQLQVIV